MQKVYGMSVHNGICAGKIFVVKKSNIGVERELTDDVSAEISRLEDALRNIRNDFQELYRETLLNMGKDQAALFDAYQAVMEDEVYLDFIYNIIHAESVKAEYAVETAGRHYMNLFESMDDPYMRSRSMDVRAITDKLLEELSGKKQTDLALTEPSIIIAKDLTPEETLRMDMSYMMGFVTVEGSRNSHTAILAGTRDIPAIINAELKLDGLENGMLAIVDGYCGEVIIEPDEEELETAWVRIREDREQVALLKSLRGKENITLDGKRIEILANIGDAHDVDAVLENDAGGIGLFRSEFLYLGRTHLPSEEEQFATYKRVLESMQDKKVIIRTLDVGADKKVDYLHLGKEENPAMGLRAIRLCLERPSLFKTQLRALLRAAVYGNLLIMYPMITSTEEVERIQAIIEEVKMELDAESIAYHVPEQGVMIETPAAALISDELAEMVDFMSIGTNDLTQYTLALDRQNGKLNDFYNPHHKAIFRMIRMVVDHAHKAGKWVGICGELGAEEGLVEEFIRMGVDELSVEPSAILKLRKKVRESVIDQDRL